MTDIFSTNVSNSNGAGITAFYGRSVVSQNLDAVTDTGTLATRIAERFYMFGGPEQALDVFGFGEEILTTASTGTENDLNYYEFGSGSRQTLDFIGKTSEEFRSNRRLNARVTWYSDQASGSAIALEGQIKRLAQDDPVTGDFASVTTVIDASTGSGLIQETNIELQNASLDDLSKFDNYVLRVARDPLNGSDDLAGSVKVLSVEVTQV